MGLFDRIRGLTQPYNDDEDDFYDDIPQTATERSHVSEPYNEPEPVSRNPFAGLGLNTDYTESASRRPARDNKVVNINTTAQLQVVLAKPERFESASEIADHLREKRTVVLNLENTNNDTARRLLDFLSGVAYAQDGKIKKVAASTYIITPYNVDIIGDLMDELESNGLYF
jgi:cell division inhibitor SepF